MSAVSGSHQVGNVIWYVLKFTKQKHQGHEDVSKFVLWPWNPFRRLKYGRNHLEHQPIAQQTILSSKIDLFDSGLSKNPPSSVKSIQVWYDLTRDFTRKTYINFFLIYKVFILRETVFLI